MDALVMFVRRTWLPTTLCVLVAVAIYWGWFSWDSARETIVPTAVLTPITWWWIAGRKSHPSLRRGFLAGATIGPVTQALPGLMPEIWRAHGQRGLGNGEDQAIAMATVFVYLLVGICSIPIGGVVGLIVVLIQRNTGRSPSDNAASKRVTADG